MAGNREVNRNYSELLAVVGGDGDASDTSTPQRQPAQAKRENFVSPKTEAILAAPDSKPSSSKAYNELLSMFNEGGGSGRVGGGGNGGGNSNPVSSAQANIEKFRRLQASAMAAGRSPSGGGGGLSGIEAELLAAKAQVDSQTAVPRAVNGNGANTSAAAQAALAMRMARTNSGSSSRGGRNGQGGQKLTKEQVIVGHYCRHATKLLDKVLEGKPNKKMLEEELRQRIKNYWGLWIHGRLRKHELLEKVAAFVNNSCPEARNISVDREFRTWYQAQVAHTATLRKQQQQQQQRRLMMQRIQQQQDVVKRQMEQVRSSNNLQLQQQLAQQQKILQEKRQQLLAPEGKDNLQPAGSGPANNTNLGSSASNGNGNKSERDDEGDDDKLLIPPKKATSTPPRRPKPPPARVPPKIGRENPNLAGTKHALSSPTSDSQQGKKFKASKAGKRPPGHGKVAGKSLLMRPASSNKPAAANTNRPRRVDDELNFVTNIVDIEREEEALVDEAQGDANSSAVHLDTNRYAQNMLLSGPTLRRKLERITRRHSLETVSMETIELVSLAARERLSAVIEALKETAQARKDVGRSAWTTVSTGHDMRKKLQAIRKDEQRSLDVAKELRKRKRKQAEEEDAAKAVSGSAVDGKTGKELAAAAEAARKEMAALEKKKQAASSTDRALKALTAGLTRRKKKAKAAAAQKAAGATFPSWTRTQSGSNGTISGKSSLKSGQSGVSSSMKAVAAVVNAAASKGQLSSSAAQINGVTRPGDFNPGELQSPITLRDCIFVMQHEHNSRTSPLLFKWASRLSVGDPKYQKRTK